METVTLNKLKIKAVPNLRFKEFEEDLDNIILNDIVNFNSGGTPSKSNALYWNGDIPWISATSMIGKYYSTSERKITPEGLRNGSKLAPKGSLLLLVRGSMLFNNIPIGIAQKDVAFNQDLKSLCTNEKSSSDFLYQWFMAKQNQLLNKVVGTGIGAGKLDTSELQNLKIKLPSNSEQHKIASFLSAVDKKNQQLTLKKELLETYKKGVMQQLFSQEIRFKDKDGKEFPEWEKKKLGTIAIITMGQSPNSISYNEVGVGKPLIQGNADIKNRITRPRQWTSEPTKECEIGDLLMTVRAPVGYIAKTKHNACIGRGVCSIRNNAFSNIEFLYQFLKNYELKWVRIEQGSTFSAVSGNDIKTIGLKLPCLQEQQKIADFLSAIDRKIETVQQQIIKTQSFKKGLLQQMFV